MKKFLYSSFLICFFVGLVTACISTVNYTKTMPTAIIVSSATQEKSRKEEYTAALEQWKSHNIENYEITVDVFSSILAPACQMKSTLQVENNTLVHVMELITPEPYQLPSNELILNPQCSEYDRYQITSLFDLFNDWLGKELFFGEYIHDVKFNFKYGYITHLIIKRGESILEIKTSDLVINE